MDAIKEDLENTKGDVEAARGDIETIKKDLDYVKNVTPPPGTILAWVPRFEENGNDVVELPGGKVKQYTYLGKSLCILFYLAFKRCDGSGIDNDDSPFNGKRTPNLNSDGYYVRPGREPMTFHEHSIFNHE